MIRRMKKEVMSQLPSKQRQQVTRPKIVLTSIKGLNRNRTRRAQENARQNEG